MSDQESNDSMNEMASMAEAVPASPPPSGAPAEGDKGFAPLPKHKNVFLVWFVWPLITFGIYHLVWYYKVNRETNFNPRNNADPLVSLIAVTFGALIIVPPFVSIYNTGKRIAEAQRAAGLRQSCNPWIGVLLMFVLSLYSLYYQSEMNKIAESYPGALPSQPVPLRNI